MHLELEWFWGGGAVHAVGHVGFVAVTTLAVKAILEKAFVPGAVSHLPLPLCQCLYVPDVRLMTHGVWAVAVPLTGRVAWLPLIAQWEAVARQADNTRVGQLAGPRDRMRVEHVGSRLAQHSEAILMNRNPPVRFEVVQSAECNALATLDNTVQLTSGLLQLLSRKDKGKDDSLALVLAHELGHIVAR
jgi:Zn-dependent protease with chaperone function